MKRTFTFIVACFVVASLSGQTGKARIAGLDKMHPFKSKILANKDEERKSAKHHPIKNYTFNNHQVSKLKSSYVVKQKLDSIVYENIDFKTGTAQMERWKPVFTYDSNGNIIREIEYDWNAITGKWVSDYKSECIYNSDGNMIQDNDYNWDETTNKWVGSRKTESIYDSNGNITQEIYNNWDEVANQWVGSWKTESTYNTHGSLTKYINYRYDKSTNLWVGSYKYETAYNSNDSITQEIYYTLNETATGWAGNSKYENTYNANGNKTLKIDYNWNKNTSKWVGSEKTEYTLNTIGNTTLKIDYIWNEATSQWTGSAKVEYTYNSNGNMTQSIFSGWNTNTNQWVVVYKYEYLYNENGIMTQEIEYNWNYITSQWVVGGNSKNPKSEWIYDTDGNLTQEIAYIWDESTSQLVGSWKYENTYDNSILFDELWLPLDFYLDDFSYSKNKLISVIEYSWNKNTGQWKIDSKDSLYYSDQDATSTISVLNGDLNIYPNPTTDRFRIAGLDGKSKIEISDINGRVWLSKEIFNNEYVPTDVLPQGIYLVKINTGKGSTVTKLVKQ